MGQRHAAGVQGIAQRELVQQQAVCRAVVGQQQRQQAYLAAVVVAAAVVMVGIQRPRMAKMLIGVGPTRPIHPSVSGRVVGPAAMGHLVQPAQRRRPDQRYQQQHQCQRAQPRARLPGVRVQPGGEAGAGWSGAHG